MNRGDEETAEVIIHPSSPRPPQSPADEELRCVKCDAPVADVACGRVMPCPSCGFQYPLGDCSDYAEN
ncbi:MAG: hypothetical protein L0226_14080 [Acidobacteria bacterium]|nr:hypothetical protein [Acidobacteriota bacterium]